MSEYMRTINPNNGDNFQWVDSEMCMVLDSVTGKTERFGANNNSIGTTAEAMEYVGRRHGWEDRMVVIKVACICAYRIEA